MCFNPRTHVGCDLLRVRNGYPLQCFNPRTHVGCDLMNPQNVIVKYMFQSTHPRRVRHNGTAVYSVVLSFQSTHPRRVRLARREKLAFCIGFNPRTHVGCDL